MVTWPANVLMESFASFPVSFGVFETRSIFNVLFVKTPNLSKK